MKVRLAILIGVIAGFATGGAAHGLASTASTGDWGCVVVRPVNQGVCLENPLPERLPQPSVPSTPTV